MAEGASEIILYQTEDGGSRIEVRLQDNTVWLSQALMSELFQTSKQNISLHVQNIFDEGELQATSVVKDYLTTAGDGKKYKTAFYNLDVIISVGYRVKSHRGTQFRIWATQRLSEFLVKGFVLDDARLKGDTESHDYFDELLARVRDIRTSEKRFYEKVRDIYATSVDYDPNSPVTQDFFATVQNKFHFAITGRTAAELIAARADASQPNMGLKSWKGERVRRSDVATAKNYYEPDELHALNLIVDQYLSFAESQAHRRIPMHMVEWVKKLHGFLELNDRQILKDAGRISADAAKQIADKEFDRFDAKRKVIEASESLKRLDGALDGIAKTRKLGAGRKTPKNS
ncbi:MAG TPA: virulence RhuM family protein [Pirellulales bacterium]|jgi:hypothetical protein|nr:virulence RhuM family protein [Pirellulales bacterium]